MATPKLTPAPWPTIPRLQTEGARLCRLVPRKSACASAQAYLLASVGDMRVFIWVDALNRLDAETAASQWARRTYGEDFIWRVALMGD
jgi:hypothetical protein